MLVALGGRIMMAVTIMVIRIIMVGIIIVLLIMLEDHHLGITRLADLEVTDIMSIIMIVVVTREE